MSDSVFGWHFVGDALRDGRPVPADGDWLEHDGEPVMCESGLHGSERILDALEYAPGNTICWCEFGGEIVHGDDKMVATRRRILWRVDGEDIVRRFARWCALSAIDLWDAPAVVREYLETGDESLGAAARAAAWAAAGDAAWAAARAAARDAAWAAARAAARDAAWAAARAATGAATGDAMGDAAWDAARDAAWAATGDAMGAAARDAARAAAWAAQNEQLERMVREEHESSLAIR